jgi:hypothetical protein
MKAKLQLPPSVTEAYKAAQQQQERWERRHLMVEVLALMAVIGAGFVAWFQLNAMSKNIKEAITLNELTRDSVQASKDSAEAARISADAARTQADVAKAQAAAAERANTLTEETFKADQRAYLTFSMGMEKQPTDGTYRIIVPITISGKTPARRVRFDAVVNVGDKSDPPLDQIQNREWHIVGDIDPNEQHRAVHAEGTIPPAAVEQYAADKARLFVLAEIRYCDVFGQPHVVTRCGHFGTNTPNVRYCGTTTTNPRDRSECERSQ